MKPSPTSNLASAIAEESPTAWFAVLERGLRTGDTELVERAVRRLEQLGVRVEFREATSPSHRELSVPRTGP